ncbi:carboxypeptidase regulatory-like domain-containing protein [Polynucleobacter rarus]|uniref:carboxypeptidase regulatory-like domain-containing protein n=1 Tax=Polynucleobacter rarus TaxID=556055 RepID=UPI00131F115F|nr:carboxypeptidase regulatory-like domain-containing protein [Polynucleobacter rarus]
MKKLLLLTISSVLIGFISLASAQSSEEVLSGQIIGPKGQNLEGVTVSARAQGSTITTSVYTDLSGHYIFPALPKGIYSVWSQALGFEWSRKQVTLQQKTQLNFKLELITDSEKKYRQLPPEMLVAALPESSDHDALMKRIFTTNCTGCHSPAYPLQFKFDEAGWNKIINLMSVVPVSGVYPGPNAKANSILKRHQSELAQYLANARGPGPTSMVFKDRPRPTGEAARAVWRLYDIPRNESVGMKTNEHLNDGTDWSKGATSKIGQIPHDGGLGLDGTIYFSSNSRNTRVTIGKIDPKTGVIKNLKYPGINGLAASSHGLVRDTNGNFWFDADTGRRALGKLDTLTDKITVYQTPASGSPVGGAVSVDVAPNGEVWISSPNGAFSFNPSTEKFTEYKSLIPGVGPRGSGATYGVAADKQNNGWWAQMGMDTIYKSDKEHQSAIPLKIPDVEVRGMSAEDRAFYEKFDGLGFNAPLPYSAGPRRMGTDKESNILWVGNSWGASLSKIDPQTMDIETVKFPEPTMQPYMVYVDHDHNVWGNLWSSDRIFRYNPEQKQWAFFDLPVRATEIRHLSVLDKNGKFEVVVPVYRTNQMGVMTLRSEKQLTE